MLEVVDGDIFSSDADIIAHQTNCLGIMGGGVALTVRKKYPEVFEEYVTLCKEYEKKPEQLLGYTQFVPTNDGRLIANCFGQCGVSGERVLTNYQALKLSLSQVRSKAEHDGLSVAIPYNIGCGLAGGDWNTVEQFIKELFEESNVQCTLYKYQG
jgi:O-acetyl-ADP-ribose deacetylase (regulator of RNase III)